MKKKKLIIIGSILAAFIIIAGVAATAIGMGRLRNVKETNGKTNRTRSPKEIVWDAFINTFDSSSESALSSALHMSEREAYLQNKPVEYGMDMAFESAKGYFEELKYLEGFSISFNGESSAEKRENYLNAAINYGELSMDASLFCDGDSVFLGSNLLEDNVIYLDLTEDLLEQMKKSMLFKDYVAELSESDITEFTDAAEYFEQMEKASKAMQALGEKYADSKAVSEFQDSVSVEKTDSKSMKYEENEISADGYDITVKSSDFAEFVVASGDYLIASDEFQAYIDLIYSMEPEYSSMNLEDSWEQEKDSIRANIEELGDLTVTVYIYDDVIVSVEMESEPDEETSDATGYMVTVNNLGGSFPFANSEIILELDTGAKVTFSCKETKNDGSVGSVMELNYEENSRTMHILELKTSFAEESGKLSIKLNLAGQLRISLDSTVTENTKDALNIDINSIEIADLFGDQIVMSGTITHREHSGDISRVEGSEINIMTDNENEIMNLILDVQSALQNLNGLEELFSMNEEMF